jgi:hypothetical protein
VLRAELQQSGKVDGGAILLRELLAERGGVLGVRDDFEFPA